MRNQVAKFDPYFEMKFGIFRKLIVLGQHISITKLNTKSKDVFIGSVNDLSNEYDDCVVLCFEIMDNSTVINIFLI